MAAAAARRWLTWRWQVPLLDVTALLPVRRVVVAAATAAGVQAQTKTSMFATWAAAVASPLAVAAAAARLKADPNRARFMLVAAVVGADGIVFVCFCSFVLSRGVRSTTPPLPLWTLSTTMTSSCRRRRPPPRTRIQNSCRHACPLPPAVTATAAAAAAAGLPVVAPNALAQLALRRR